MNYLSLLLTFFENHHMFALLFVSFTLLLWGILHALYLSVLLKKSSSAHDMQDLLHRDSPHALLFGRLSSLQSVLPLFPPVFLLISNSLKIFFILMLSTRMLLSRAIGCNKLRRAAFPLLPRLSMKELSSMSAIPRESR